MPTIHFIKSDGSQKTVDAQEGDTLLDVALEHGIEGIIGECGGSKICGTCHCYIVTPNFDQIGAPTSAEKRILKTVVDPRESSRLACQVEVSKLLDGTAIIMPSSQYSD